MNASYDFVFVFFSRARFLCSSKNNAQVRQFVQQSSSTLCNTASRFPSKCLTLLVASMGACGHLHINVMSVGCCESRIRRICVFAVFNVDTLLDVRLSLGLGGRTLGGSSASKTFAIINPLAPAASTHICRRASDTLDYNVCCVLSARARLAQHEFN